MTGQWVEKGTNQHSSREAAQRASLQTLGSAIARAVRAGLESGRFVVVDGVVRLSKSPYNMPITVNVSRRLQ
jgi:hypothetical protein